MVMMWPLVSGFTDTVQVHIADTMPAREKGMDTLCFKCQEVTDNLLICQNTTWAGTGKHDLDGILEFWNETEDDANYQVVRMEYNGYEA
jgi:hypothetical protein